eukprot:499263_1
MGSCFGRNRDQDDHNIVNEGLLENEIDLESQQVTTPPTHSFPKHGSLSSLVPSKRLVLAVIGAFLLLCFIIGGYRHFKKNGGVVTNLPQNDQMDIANDGTSDVLESINVVDSARDDVGMDSASTGSPNNVTNSPQNNQMDIANDGTSDVLESINVVDSASDDGSMDYTSTGSPNKFTRARRRMESESVDDMDSASTGSLTNSKQQPGKQPLSPAEVQHPQQFVGLNRAVEHQSTFHPPTKPADSQSTAHAPPNQLARSTQSIRLNPTNETKVEPLQSATSQPTGPP